MKRVPIIDINTGRVVKDLKKRHVGPLKTVLLKGLTFFEYEILEDFLRTYKDTKKVDTVTNYSSRWQGETYQWKNVIIELEGNSMFLGGNIEVKAPSKKEWNDFLNTHLKFKKKLDDIELSGELEYDDDLEEWRRNE